MKEFIRKMHTSVPDGMGDDVQYIMSDALGYMASDVWRRASDVDPYTMEQVTETVREIREKHQQCLSMSIDTLSVMMHNTLLLKMPKQFNVQFLNSTYCHELINMLLFKSADNGNKRERITRSIVTQAACDLGWRNTTSYIDVYNGTIIINDHFVIDCGEHMTLNTYEIMCRNVIDIGDELTSDNYIKMFKELIDDVAPYAELLNRMGELYIDNPDGINVDVDEPTTTWFDKSRYDLDIPTTKVVEI